MTINRRHFIGASVVAAAGLVAPAAFATSATRPAQTLSPVPGSRPSPNFIEQALSALERHSQRIVHRDLIAVADYSLHSKEQRFHLVDVAAGKIRKSYLVSHGKGSDRSNSGYVQRFSNRPGSNASSRGSFLTGETYYGKHGRSRRLHGLEPENDRAFARAIVIHGADYVDRAMVESQGRVGRSLGCFAFERREIAEVLELLGPGRLLYSAK